MSQRLTGKAATKATARENARLPQKRGLVSPASIAPGMRTIIRLSTISMIVIESVSEERQRQHRRQCQPRPQQWEHRQRVAEEEREHNGQDDRRYVAPPQRGPDHHPQNLADRTSRETVRRRTERQPV